MILLFLWSFFFQCLFLQVRTQSLREQEPNGIHLVYGAEPSSQMNIIWWTKYPVSTAIVYYSLIDKENDYVPIETISCSHNMLQKGFLARNSTNGKFIQRVYLSNLLPNRRYCYEITSGRASSHIFSFRTADISIELGIKNNDDTHRHSNFIVYGSDLQPLIQHKNSEHLNSNYSSNNLIPDYLDANSVPGLNSLLESFKNQLNDKKINAFINLPTIHLKEYINQSKRFLNSYDFLDLYSDVLSNVPLLPSVGQLGDKTSLNLFRSMFPMGGKTPFNSYFYSLNDNGVHFISYSADLFTVGQFSDRSTSQLDSNTMNIIDNQIDLIEKDLINANQNRDFCPWIVVIVSQSVTCIDSSCSSIINDVLKQKLEALFYEYNVDLILESGSNVYERSYPVVKTLGKYKTDYKTPEMPVSITLPKYSIGTNRKITEDWSAFKFQPYDDHTYGLLEVSNSTALKWSYIYSNGTVIDRFSLFKNHNGAFERIYDARKQLFNSIKFKSSSNYNTKTISAKQISHKWIAFTVIFILISITIGYMLVKRHLKMKRAHKLNSNYSNLIENEFDT